MITFAQMQKIDSFAKPKNVICDACTKAKASQWVGNLCGFYVAMCEKCWKQFTFDSKNQTKGFSPKVARLIDKSNAEFAADCKKELKKVRVLQRRHGRNWRRVAQSML
jgi:hypothetical protein